MPFTERTAAVQRQFAHHDKITKLIGLHLFARREHPDGDGQVETRPLFFDVGRSEIDRGAAKSEIKPGIDQRRHYPVPGFLHRGVGKADDNDDRVSVPGIDFDLNGISFDAVDGGGTSLGQHSSSVVRPSAKCNKEV